MVSHQIVIFLILVFSSSPILTTNVLSYSRSPVQQIQPSKTKKKLPNSTPKTPPSISAKVSKKGKAKSASSTTAANLSLQSYTTPNTCLLEQKFKFNQARYNVILKMDAVSAATKQKELKSSEKTAKNKPG